jgi:hypothetical protein
MATIINIDSEFDYGKLKVVLQKGVQSANLNFMIGSGCSYPAIATLGNIEEEVQDKMDDEEYDDADIILFNYLKPFAKSVLSLKSLKDEEYKGVLEKYESFLKIISKILFERKNNIIPKQATIFTTNYDLFVEKASEVFIGSIRLNDGFERNPVLNNRFRFSSSEFFTSVYNTGNLYNYEVQIPSINLIKLHGSLSWKKSKTDIIFSTKNMEDLLKEWKKLDTEEETDLPEIRALIEKFPVILPTKEKFKDTLFNQIYYDLLRIYANELDKENTLLIVDGFSFADEHILEITKRALKNPTLLIIIICFIEDELESFEQKFSSYNNVFIAYAEDKEVDFMKFQDILKGVLPQAEQTETIEDDSESVDDENE